MPSQMFLRTALTENRIEALEKQMRRVLAHLKLPEDEEALSDEEWEAARLPRQGYSGEPGAGEDAPLPELPAKPMSKVAERIAKGKTR